MFPEDRGRNNMSDYEIRKKLVAATVQSVAKAREVLGVRMSAPPVVFDLRGTTAGIAITTRDFFQIVPSKIRYNLGLARENLESFVSKTIPHEVSHLVANVHFGKNCGHGREWKYVMQKVFGIEPNRCHQYDVRNHRARQTKVHVYRCACGEINIGTKHHNLIHSNLNHSSLK